MRQTLPGAFAYGAPPARTVRASAQPGSRQRLASCSAAFATGAVVLLKQRLLPAAVATTLVAMANPRRSQRVSQQIMREISTLMLSDKRTRSVMSPEHRLGADGSITTVTSVTEVVLSADLAVAKVFVSFFGDARGADVAFAALQRLEPYLRSQVGKAMQMRHVPELRFFRDDGSDRGGKVLGLLDSLRAEASVAAAQSLVVPFSPLAGAAGDSSGDEYDLLYADSEESDSDIIMIDSDSTASDSE